MEEILKFAMLALKVSLVAQVFAIGLGTKWASATYLFRHPKLLLNSILARNVAMPIIAILLIKAFSLRSAVAIAIAVLSVTPVPPLLPKSQLKAGGQSDYVLGLLVSQTVLAVVIVPLTNQIMNWTFGSQARFSAEQVAMLMLKAILIPLGAGMIARRLIPRLEHFARNILLAGTVLLLLGALPLLPFVWKMFTTLLGSGTLLAIAIFVVAGIAIGHFLGGPDPANRTVLALATSARHPAVALAIAKANFPEQSNLISGAVVLYLMFRLILAAPYLRVLTKEPKTVRNIKQRGATSY